jgi:hypothetical protein
VPERDASLHILQHALGLDQYGRAQSRVPGYDRNYFVADEGGGPASDWGLCMAHVEAGRMKRHGPRAIFGGDNSYCFTVTDAGKAYVREHSPKPPKRTRSQRRYAAFIEADSSLSFGEWMKSEWGRQA